MRHTKQYCIRGVNSCGELLGSGKEMFEVVLFPAVVRQSLNERLDESRYRAGLILRIAK